jgi:hypothetical protein
VLAQKVIQKSCTAIVTSDDEDKVCLGVWGEERGDEPSYKSVT